MAKKKQKHGKCISIRGDTYDELRTKAHTSGCSMASVVEEEINRWLDENPRYSKLTLDRIKMNRMLIR